MRLRRILVLAWLFVTGLAGRPLHAALGETASEIEKRFGRPDPQLQQGAHKNVVVWAIETPQSERLIYTVTFDRRGRSIAEGLKPGRRAILDEEIAKNFVANQLAVRKDDKTTRLPRPGEKYTFAGELFTRAPNEEVWVDEGNDLMVIRATGREPFVLAVRADFLRGTY